MGRAAVDMHPAVGQLREQLEKALEELDVVSREVEVYKAELKLAKARIHELEPGTINNRQSDHIVLC